MCSNGYSRQTWNGFIRGFVVLSYVPKLVDGAMPFALGAAQCFAAYFVARNVHGWYWSFAALSIIGFIGYINAEINARINPKENAHIMVYYGQQLRILQISALFLAAVCGGIAYSANCSSEMLTLPSFALAAGYAVGDEVLWLRLEIRRRHTLSSITMTGKMGGAAHMIGL